MNGRRPRLAVVLSHPTQYYSPWFRWLATHAAVDLRVFYLWNFGVTSLRDPQFETSFQWDVDLLSGYAAEFVPNLAVDPGTHHFAGLRNPELVDRLAAWRPEALLLFGYKSWSHLRAIFWARRNGIPLLFRGDSHFLGRGPSGSARFILRTLYRQFAAFLPVGSANHDYFRQLGVPERKLFFAPHAVNAGFFDPQNPAFQESAAALRRQLGLDPGVCVTLFAGKLAPEKDPLTLLSAFVAADLPRAALVFVGSGPEQNALAAAARGAPRYSIHFLPFANQSEMPSRYLLADIFALPSRGLYETWGLAVNEAMHMGIPALVSDLVGCQRDLVTDGETGWVFRAGDHAGLVQSLRLAHAANRDQMKAAVAKRIAGYTYKQTTAGLMSALAALGLATGDSQTATASR